MTTRAMRGQGGEGVVMLVAKKYAPVCARNYSGAQFIAKIRGPILISSPDPGTAGYWEGKLNGSYGSRTLQLQFRPAC